MATVVVWALLCQWITSSMQADAIKISKHSRTAVRARMEYWKDYDAVRAPIAPSGDRYLFFDHDTGGLNNLRIGWEMAALAAVETNRTLVYPTWQTVYLLGAEPSGFSYYVNMDLLHSGLSAMSIKDFIKREESHYEFPHSLLEWSRQPGGDEDFQNFPSKEWHKFRHSQMSSAGGDQTTCDMETYRASAKLLYTTPNGGGRIFSCGNWPNVGEPRFTDNHRKWNAPDSDFSLLRNHFVWHPDAFDIASRVVAHLGLFNYVSMHARYGDFQFQKHKGPQQTLLAHGWLSPPSLLETGITSATHSLLSTSQAAALARGQRALHVVRSWLGDDMSRPIYIATDDRSKEYLEPFRKANLKVVRWQELMDDAKNGHGPLADVIKTYSPERISNFCGVVEQLICTYGKVFVGSEKSTFSGYIERMRLYAQAPTHATYIKYAGMYASDKGLRLFHDDEIDEKVEAKVADQIASWEKSNLASSLDRNDFGRLPLNAA